MQGTSNTPPLITRARHRAHLSRAIEHLDNFLVNGTSARHPFNALSIFLFQDDDVVLATEELRCAAQEIGRITGRVGIEEILDVVFSTFCIGK